MNGAKTLVLDPALAGPLGLVTEVALLKVNPFDADRMVRQIDPHHSFAASWRGQDVLARTWTTDIKHDKCSIPMQTSDKIRQGHCRSVAGPP